MYNAHENFFLDFISMFMQYATSFLHFVKSVYFIDAIDPCCMFPIAIQCTGDVIPYTNIPKTANML